MKIKKSTLVKLIREELKESYDSPQAYSSPEAEKIVDDGLKNWTNDIRKVEGRVIKDWMTKAKSGAMDYFDLVRGLETGDIARAKPFETRFLKAILDRDKITDRFRQYFGGKKGKKRPKKRSRY